MSSITLHPEYGVNPTLGICFWCGQEDGTIGLLGRNKGKEAPRHTILSYEPCQKCKDGMAQGITCIEASEVPNTPNQPSMDPKRDVYPTGSFSVIKEEAAERIFGQSPFWADMQRLRKAYLDKSTYKMIFGKEAEPNEQTHQG